MVDMCVHSEMIITTKLINSAITSQIAFPFLVWREHSKSLYHQAFSILCALPLVTPDQTTFLESLFLSGFH